MKLYKVVGCSNHCDAGMWSADPPEEHGKHPWSSLAEDCYVHFPDHLAALAAKDAAIRDMLAAMERAHKCLSVPRNDRYPSDEMVARDWLADMIAKHAPKEANDAKPL